MSHSGECHTNIRYSPEDGKRLLLKAGYDTKIHFPMYKRTKKEMGWGRYLQASVEWKKEKVLNYLGFGIHPK